MYPYQRHAPSEDGPTRPIRLMFPILEHPDQRPEQAPPPHPNMRGMLYEFADGIEPDYFEPLNIFWDEGNTRTESTRGDIDQPSTPTEAQQTRQRHESERCVDARVIIVLAVVVLIMCSGVAITLATLCIEQQCGTSSTVHSPSSEVHVWTTLPPSSRPVLPPITASSDQGDNNIFLRPPSPMPTLFPFENDDGFFHNIIATTSAPSSAAVVIHDDGNVSTSHNFTNVPFNATNTTMNSTSLAVPLGLFLNITANTTGNASSSFPVYANTTATTIMSIGYNSTASPILAITPNSNQTSNNSTFGATSAPSQLMSFVAEQKQPLDGR